MFATHKRLGALGKRRAWGTAPCLHRVSAGGAFGVTSAMRIYHEEQFGLLPIVPIADVSQFTDYMLDTTYGQQASLFGQDERTLGRLIDVLSTQVCRINLNSQCQRGPDVSVHRSQEQRRRNAIGQRCAAQLSIRSMVAANGNQRAGLVRDLGSRPVKLLEHRHHPLTRRHGSRTWPGPRLPTAIASTWICRSIAIAA